MAPVERYFQSFDATNSLQSTVLRMKCGVNIWFFANSKSVYYLRTPPFPTSEIVSNEIELIHDVNQHSTLGNNMTYMCSKNGDHLSYDEVQVRSKLHFGVTQPTATIPTIWGEGSQVWTFCTNKCFFACLSLYDVFVPIFVYYSVAFFYDCLTYFQSRPQKSTALKPPGRLWWEQATV